MSRFLKNLSVNFYRCVVSSREPTFRNLISAPLDPTKTQLRSTGPIKSLHSTPRVKSQPIRLSHSLSSRPIAKSSTKIYGRNTCNNSSYLPLQAKRGLSKKVPQSSSARTFKTGGGKASSKGAPPDKGGGVSCDIKKKPVTCKIDCDEINKESAAKGKKTAEEEEGEAECDKKESKPICPEPPKFKEICEKSKQLQAICEEECDEAEKSPKECSDEKKDERCKIEGATFKPKKVMKFKFHCPGLCADEGEAAVEEKCPPPPPKNKIQKLCVNAQEDCDEEPPKPECKPTDCDEGKTPPKKKKSEVTCRPCSSSGSKRGGGSKPRKSEQNKGVCESEQREKEGKIKQPKCNMETPRPLKLPLENVEECKGTKGQAAKKVSCPAPKLDGKLPPPKTSDKSVSGGITELLKSIIRAFSGGKKPIKAPAEKSNKKSQAKNSQKEDDTKFVTKPQMVESGEKCDANKIAKRDCPKTCPAKKNAKDCEKKKSMESCEEQQPKTNCKEEKKTSSKQSRCAMKNGKCASLQKKKSVAENEDLPAAKKTSKSEKETTNNDPYNCVKTKKMKESKEDILDPCKPTANLVCKPPSKSTSKPSCKPKEGDKKRQKDCKETKSKKDCRENFFNISCDNTATEAQVKKGNKCNDQKNEAEDCNKQRAKQLEDICKVQCCSMDQSKKSCADLDRNMKKMSANQSVCAEGKAKKVKQEKAKCEQKKAPVCLSIEDICVKYKEKQAQKNMKKSSCPGGDQEEKDCRWEQKEMRDSCDEHPCRGDRKKPKNKIQCIVGGVEGKEEDPCEKKKITCPVDEDKCKKRKQEKKQTECYEDDTEDVKDRGRRSPAGESNKKSQAKNAQKQDDRKRVTKPPIVESGEKCGAQKIAKRDGSKKCPVKNDAKDCEKKKSRESCEKQQSKTHCNEEKKTSSKQSRCSMNKGKCASLQKKKNIAENEDLPAAKKIRKSEKETTSDDPYNCVKKKKKESKGGKLDPCKPAANLVCKPPSKPTSKTSCKPKGGDKKRQKECKETKSKKDCEENFLNISCDDTAMEAKVKKGNKCNDQKNETEDCNKQKAKQLEVICKIQCCSMDQSKKSCEDLDRSMKKMSANQSVCPESKAKKAKQEKAKCEPKKAPVCLSIEDICAKYKEKQAQKNTKKSSCSGGDQEEKACRWEQKEMGDSCEEDPCREDRKKPKKKIQCMEEGVEEKEENPCEKGQGKKIACPGEDKCNKRKKKKKQN